MIRAKSVAGYNRFYSPYHEETLSTSPNPQGNQIIPFFIQTQRSALSICTKNAKVG